MARLTDKEIQARIEELERERSVKLDTLNRWLKRSIEKQTLRNGTPFGKPNADIFARIIEIEAQIQELDYLVD